jgi:hypothetical protein
MPREHILKLRPTQLAVGFQQVHEKANKLKGKSHADLYEYLETHAVPVVKGIDCHLYIIDHHHLCSAALSIGVDKVFTKIVEDWSMLTEEEFWDAMKSHKYIWLYDEHGVEISLDKFIQLLPTTVKNLKNDPYRSLAGVVRKMGVYEKDWTPYSEFVWAGYFRKLMVLPEGQVKNFSEETLREAKEHALRPEARRLPGYKDD